MTAIQVAAQGGNPQYRLVQRRHLVRRPSGPVYAAIQGLPFNWLKDHFTGQFAIEASQQGRVEDTPGDHGKQCRSTNETL
ncbi:hypothetical protein SAMN05192544_111719, partial [Paraburkholderia hospita]